MMVGVEPLLRVSGLHVSFETSRGSIRAVDGVDLGVGISKHLVERFADLTQCLRHNCL